MSPGASAVEREAGQKGGRHGRTIRKGRALGAHGLSVFLPRKRSAVPESDHWVWLN